MKTRQTTGDISKDICWQERPMRNDWLVFFCQTFFVFTLLAQFGILVYFCF